VVKSASISDGRKEHLGIPPSFFSAKWEDWTTELPGQREWATTAYVFAGDLEKNLELGKGLTLLGKVGTGKSMLAALIALEAEGLHRSACFIKEKDLFDAIRAGWDVSGYDEKYHLRRYRNCRLLVIDDFDVRKQTEYVGEIYQDILDARYEQKLSTLLTSNTHIDDLIERYPRQMDRLARNEVVVMTGESMRG